MGFFISVTPFLLFLKKIFFEVDENFNFRWVYYRELNLFEIFNGKNFPESLPQFETNEIQFYEFAPKSLKLLLAKISSLKVVNASFAGKVAPIRIQVLCFGILKTLVCASSNTVL